MSSIKFEEWPVISAEQFEAVIVDAVKFKEGHYGAMINFFKSFAKDTTEKNVGMSIYSNITGDTLEELYVKIDMLIEIGFFGDTQVDGVGTLYDTDWNEIGEIDWNDLDVEYADDEPTDTPAKPSTYLH